MTQTKPAIRWRTSIPGQQAQLGLQLNGKKVAFPVVVVDPIERRKIVMSSMARQAAEKTTRINREPPEHMGIEKYLPRAGYVASILDGMEDDMPPGERLIECFRPFIEHLAASGKSRRTIQEHVDNMWALGGEFITELNYDPTLRKRPLDRVLRELIRYGGPHLRHADGEQQASFDTTCEMFRQFLGKTAR